MTDVIVGNLKDQIHAILKQKITTGFYAPGTRLVIDSIAEEYHVSRTPIRDALNSMIPNGLISQVGKGYFVFNPNLEEVKDISALRLVLENMAVEQCTLRSTDDEIKRLEAFKAFELSRLQNMTLEEYDIAFHERILEFTRNSHLISHLQIVRELWWLIRRWTKAEISPEIKILSMQQHIDLIDRISNRDVEGAKRVMALHHNSGLGSIISSGIFPAS